MRLLLTLLLLATSGCAGHMRLAHDVSADLAAKSEEDPVEGSEEGQGLSLRLAAVPEGVELALARSTADGPETGAGKAGERIASLTPPKDWLSPRPLTTEGLQGRAAWSPDGQQIVFESTRSGGLVDNPWPQVWLMQADGSHQRRVSMGIGRTNRPGFAGGGRVLAYGSTHHTGVTEPVPGARARSGEAEIYRQDLDQGGLLRLTESPGFDADASWCADGSIAVFTSERTGELDVHALQPGSEAKRLSSSPGPDHSPAVDAACEQALWVHDGQGGSALVTASLTGGEPQVLLALPARIEDPAFWGERIVFASDLAEPGRPSELYSVGRDGQDLRRLTVTPSDEQHPAPSPDGTWLLYTDDRSGSPQLVVSPLAQSGGSPVAVP